MATNFGNEVTNTTIYYASFTMSNDATNAPFTSPGSSGQTWRIDSLDVFVSTTYSNNTIRCAIYLASNRSFVAQWDAYKTPTTDNAWLAGTSFVNQAGTAFSPNPTIVGGTDYLMAYSCGATAVKVGGKNGTGQAKYEFTDFTGGFPSTLGAGSAFGNIVSIRCVCTDVTPSGHPAIKRFGGVPFARSVNAQGINVW